jgi:hypothetical protein
LLTHAGTLGREFAIPSVGKLIEWRVFVDTRQSTPDDVFPDLNGPKLATFGRVWLEHHAMMALVSAE